ncbi:MAG TPA: SAM-dependent methyltransferase [Nocardioides sp.]|jgi:SAM-dependent methyltransferase|uniref:TRM11 family SAM-dependent methyltransferase n=1 Tax=Nocardioides sp. TaxID=35761 RepID=UPI002E33AF30|nr:SAM-dependent methyltransferase [Nocardioides sp.]HEX3931386.1 SAM-dependent methyltransferase [Nocardioides sp.]
MTAYALLVSPSANRVYARSAAALTVAELGVLAETVLAGRLGAAQVEQLGGVEYVVFEADLDRAGIAQLSNVSTLLALFERRPADDGWLLRPVGLDRLDCLDDDLLTILKYPGKTNEVFTKLLVNVTVSACGSAHRMLVDRLRVLDPLCGRGTTLNQVLMYGWHAAGIDLDGTDFDAYAAFLPRWLKDKRLKHTAATARLRREGRTLGRRLDVELATSKEAWAAQDTVTVTGILADTREAAEVFRAGSFDAVVTDAPYGVQHGSRSGDGLRRRPLELLGEALPGWVRLLRPGGAIGIAVNLRTCPRADALALLVEVGLDVRDTPSYRGFEHRVDQAIQRDIVVACKAD